MPGWKNLYETLYTLDGKREYYSTGQQVGWFDEPICKAMNGFFNQANKCPACKLNYVEDLNGNCIVCGFKRRVLIGTPGTIRGTDSTGPR